jgi:hypothetical protein
MMRCCRDTLTLSGIRQPSEGLEIHCRWCDAYLRYERFPGSETTGWVVHDRLGDFVRRESSDVATAAREAAYTRILGRERNR